MSDRKLNIAIGFATGRKHFQRILKSYAYNWLESDLVKNENVGLHLFVAYDLDYRDTKRSDYVNVDPEISQWFESKHFIGKNEMEEAKQNLLGAGIIDAQEASMLFRRGYATQRNLLLYYAMKNKMDCLLFLDDDEYPMAVSRNSDTAIWGGQHVLETHLHNIANADITYGYHCGYISPIPYVEYDDRLTEESFRCFIQALGNDIVNWDTIKKSMANGGVTYADTKVLTGREVYEVPEINHAKFISGSNLCINLTDVGRVYPFYNPPGARGEDTFLSTCLGDRKVLQLPCYTFHDGFSSYSHLLSGVLPTRLKFIKADSERVVKRFYAACVGWVRYKPLYLYITDRENYEDDIAEMNERLMETLPAVCDYFGSSKFMSILYELKKYDGTVKKQYRAFEENKTSWKKIFAAVS